MKLAVIIVIALASSAATNVLAFMIGRCARKLPIDGTLPRVIHSARFISEKDRPPTRTRQTDYSDASQTSYKQIPACRRSAAAEQHLVPHYRCHGNGYQKSAD